MGMQFQWITGGKRVAARRSSDRNWLVVRQWSLGDSIPVGLKLSLSRGIDQGEPRQVPGTRSLGLRIKSIPVWIEACLLVLVLALGILDVMRVGFVSWIPQSETLWSWWILVGSFVGAYWLLEIVDATVLSASLKGSAPVLRLTNTGFRVESAAWAVVETLFPIFISLGMPLAIGATAMAGYFDGWMDAGILLACTVSLILRTSPFHHGPMASLLAKLTQKEEWPCYFRMALASRSWSFRVGLGIGVLILWIGALLTLASLLWMSISWSGHTVILWDSMISILLLGSLIWQGLQVNAILRQAVRLNGQGKIYNVQPTEAVLDAWKSHCALIRHVPELAQLQWQWKAVDAGSYLIRYGEKDRIFYWIETGAAQVIGRDAQGDRVHFATLREGSAVGEIALLEGKARVADVLSVEAMAIACLDASEAEALSENARQRIKNFVLASQAFDRCPVLTGMSHANKEFWLAEGQAMQLEPGQVLMREGDPERWMALVVQGELTVERNGESIATLGPDSLAGEMALMFAERRRATLIAKTSVLVWKWDSKWLERELSLAGVRQDIEALAQDRERIGTFEP